MINKEAMKRINKILEHQDYQTYLKKIAFHEKDRIFCGHDMSHFLDVARIGYILIMEDGLSLSKELIYAAGLLHDIGRFLQYEKGQAHEIASGHLAQAILSDCGFSDKEGQLIIQAIVDHRNQSIKEDKTLSGYLYKADKMSRACHSCPAEKDCHWNKEKKNMTLIY